MATPSRYTALPPVYDDSALSTWIGLPASDVATLDSAMRALKEELSPEAFVSFDLFQARQWNEQTESLDDYGFALGTLLDQNGLNLPTGARESLLISRFISGLPASLQKGMRKSRDTATSFKQVVRYAKRLYTIQLATREAEPLQVNLPTSSVPLPSATAAPVASAADQSDKSAPSVQALNG
ncbi:hypothetical protein FOZ61_010632 [Perkinsus olseni]|uniref:Uncharacterized protein n=1 Tax=Perkinsus olseni TaxID=32597 RepID=A0A7J6KWL1_PEROL|nr:hypothetical protein FOZ61_010632 [Perkinsus olseni]